MNTFILTIILNTLRAMPNLVSEVEQAIKDAEATGDAADKVKTEIGDLIKFLQTIADAI